MNRFITSSKLERNSSTKIPLSFARCFRCSAKYGALYIGSSTTSYLGPWCASSSTGAYINNNNNMTWNQPIKPWITMHDSHVVFVGPSPPTTSRHKANALHVHTVMGRDWWTNIDINYKKHLLVSFSFSLLYLQLRRILVVYYLLWNMLKWMKPSGWIPGVVHSTTCFLGPC